MKYSDLFVAVDPSSAVNDSKFEKEFTTLPHSSYEWERAYCAYVKAGDVAGARQFMDFLAQSGQFITVGNVSRNELMQTKYLAVSLIAVITRVAINSGADELTIYQISDSYLQFLDGCKDNNVLVTELFLATDRMIQEVHNSKDNKKNNLYYTRCREYISSHLNQKIKVTDLAEHCGLTPNYLSYIFKQISGKNISDYILEKRIEKAKQLLLSQEHTCAEIAFFLGFTSQSYFIACFKKFVGTTPRNWKMSHFPGSGVDLYPGL